MSLVTIGLSCFDQFFYIPEYPQENKKVYATRLLENGGGPCGNASYLLGLWGEDVFHVCTLGNNNYSKFIIHELNKVGVNTDYSLVSENFITAVSSILINQQNAYRTIITHKNNTSKVFSDEQISQVDKLIDNLNESMQRHIILIDGHEFELSQYILPKIKNKLVVMDAGNLKESLLKLLPLTDYLVASESFAEGYIKFAKDMDLSVIYSNEFHLNPFYALEKLCPYVAVTLGDKGGVYFEQQQLKSFNTYPTMAVDTTGAGDIFHGAFCYGLNYNWSFKDSLNFASLVASMSTEKQGVRNAIPTFTEVENKRLRVMYTPK